jgi:Nuclease-related domain
MASDSGARAGAYAEARYRRGLHTWRSRTRLIFAVACGPFVVLGLAGLVIYGHPVVWGAGLAAGLGLGVWLTIRESPPGYIENWLDGADGERKTAKALQTLEGDGWSIVHDVQARYGNYDHIVVGRAGVFLLDTKNLNGTVEIREGVPYLHRRDDAEAHTRCVQIRSRTLAGAANLKEEIQRRTGTRLWVQAVVVFWAEFSDGLYEDDQCVFIHGSRLSDWIDERPGKMTDQVTRDVAAAVEDIAAQALVVDADEFVHPSGQ